MKPVFAKAKTQPVRVIYAEGEDERVLRATQVVLEEKLARPILVGRPSVVEARIKRFGLVDQGRAGFRPRQSRGRSALPLLCPDLYRRRRPARRDARCRAHRGPHQRHRDRGARGGPRRGRCHDLRRRRPLHEPSAPCPRDRRLPAGRQRFCGAGDDDHQQGLLFHRRHPGAAQSERRGTGGDGVAGGDPCPALQHEAARRLRVTFRLRQL